MNKNERNQNPETAGAVTHTHTQVNLKDEKFLKTKKDVAIFIAAMVVFFLGVMLISNIISTRKSLDRIIENAKIEAEKALVSSGLAVYTKDIEDNVGAPSGRPQLDENLPENTTENPQDIGTQVAPKTSWNIETVTAISVGNGETVPVPIGFYYVGGDLSTGVIISDNQDDEYEAGGEDKTTWEYTIELKGNQFVWIPCKEEEYKKCEVWNGTTQTPTSLAYTGWDKTTYTSELLQIRKYGGFYVARYEAGLAETITEFTTTQTQFSTVYNVEGIPQSKAGVIPWNFIDFKHVQTNAKKMYNTNSVSSGLITGTQWDVMLKKTVEKTDLIEGDLTNSVSWGNHMNNSIEYNGRMARGYISSGSWYLAAFGGKTEGKTSSYSSQNGDLLTTGASRQTEKYHIYDVAGNLYEITEETSLYKANSSNETNVQYIVRRSGCFVHGSSSGSVYREGGIQNGMSEFATGYRIVLYVK